MGAALEGLLLGGSSGFHFRENVGWVPGFSIRNGLKKRYCAPYGKWGSSALHEGLTLPIQRVINARFALVCRDWSLISPVDLDGMWTR